MRLKHIKNAEKLIFESSYVIREPFSFCGNWNLLFNNANPIEIEIGCGKGDFIIEKALSNADINYIGIEKYASVLLFALKKIESDIPNLRFICIDAFCIEQIFKSEISKLYLNFSDPWPKNRHEKRRLTFKTYLDKYSLLFKNDINIEMKTDNISLFEYSIESFKNSNFVIKKIDYDFQSEIKTEYEKKFLKQGNKIKYINAVKK